MKKILCIALAMTMAVGMLAGCSDKKTPADSSKPDSSEAVSSAPSSSSEVASEPVSSEPEVEAITVNSNNERLAYIIDSVRNAEDKEAFKVATNNDNGALDMLTLTEDDVTEYAMTFSMINVHAYMVAVIKPAEGKAEAVKTALTEYQKAIAKSFEQYLPDQFDIASKAVAFEHEGYMGLVMCADGETLEAQLKEALSKINEIKVVENKEVASSEATSSNTASTSSEATSASSSVEIGKETKDAQAKEEKLTGKETKNSTNAVKSEIKENTAAGEVTK